MRPGQSMTVERDSITVHPCTGVGGTIRVPGDKSISHRAAMLSSLAQGRSVIDGFLESDDCLASLRAMEQLGAGVSREGSLVTVDGTAGRLHRPAGPLDLRNSGTGMRLLAGLLAGQSFKSELTGDASLRSRPMERIRRPLETMGARLELAGAGGCAPIRITGGALRGAEYRMPVASAQVKSCILLAGLFAEGRTVVYEPRPTRDHTERMLSAMGAPVRVDALRVEIEGPCRRRLQAGHWKVPGDFSSAAFWFVAAAGTPGAVVRVENVGLNPRRTALIDVLSRMGARVEVSAGQADGDPCNVWEPRGAVTVRGGALRGTTIGGEEIPNLIDELPAVAVLAARARGATHIRGAGELRVKESDRIAGMCRALRAVGSRVEERPDGMVVHGGSSLGGGVAVDSLGDHRLAMAFGVLGLWCAAPLRVDGTACIRTSYPGFVDDLRRLTRGETVAG